MYVKCNVEGLLYNLVFSGKVIIITYSDLMFAALGIQNVMRMRHIVICCSKIFPHTVSKKARFSKNGFGHMNIYQKS
jgi:hypothetical protein